MYTKRNKSSEARIKGDAAAAKKNREIKVRRQIIEAFQRLGIPQRDWPDFVRTFGTDPDEPTGYYDSLEPLSFQPPVFERLHESPQEWTKRADAAWQQHRDRFLEAVPVLGHRRRGRGIPSREKHTRYWSDRT